MSLPAIDTARLKLLPWRQDDTDRLHALWSDAYVRRYLLDDVIISRERAAELVARGLESVERHHIGMWTVEEQGRLAGFCGFYFIDGSEEIELMYGFLEEFTGRGLATEASRAVLEYVWRNTGWLRVYARTDPPNERSLLMMERLGMRLESRTEAMVTYLLERPAI